MLHPNLNKIKWPNWKERNKRKMKHGNWKFCRLTLYQQTHRMLCITSICHLIYFIMSICVNVCCVLIIHFYLICVHSTELTCIKLRSCDRKRNLWTNSTDTVTAPHSKSTTAKLMIDPFIMRYNLFSYVSWIIYET